MNKFFILVLLGLTLAQDYDLSDLKYTFDTEILTKFNKFRQDFNIFKDIQIDSESQQSSLEELKRLLVDMDSFGTHEDFESTYENTYHSPSQFCEFICHLHKQYPSNADRCIELWSEAPEYKDHMKYEYSTGGTTCTDLGNGIICVMHVREGAGSSTSTSGSTEGYTEGTIKSTAKTDKITVVR